MACAMGVRSVGGARPALIASARGATSIVQVIPMPLTALIPGLSCSPLPHALLDEAYQMQWVNPAWLRLCTRQPALGESWFDQIDAAVLSAELPLIAKLQAGELAAYDCASRLRTADGFVAVRLHVERLAPATLLVTVLARNDRQTAAAQPAPPAASGPTGGVSAADTAILASAISHDFRQHLRLITSYLSLIERQGGAGLEAKVRHHLQTVEHHALRLQGLIVDLVQWLRLDQVPLANEPCPVAELWQEAQRRATDLPQAAAARITADADLPVITGDRALLGEALGRLLRNALQYHGPGAAQVHLAARRDGAGWCFALSDDGPGLTAVECTRVVGLFQRLHSWEQVPGNGMGLPLVQRILVRHGGSLELQPMVRDAAPSGAGAPAARGCTVQVRLPA